MSTVTLLGSGYSRPTFKNVGAPLFPRAQCVPTTGPSTVTLSPMCPAASFQGTTPASVPAAPDSVLPEDPAPPAFPPLSGPPSGAKPQIPTRSRRASVSAASRASGYLGLSAGRWTGQRRKCRRSGIFRRHGIWSSGNGGRSCALERGRRARGGECDGGGPSGGHALGPWEQWGAYVLECGAGVPGAEEVHGTHMGTGPQPIPRPAGPTVLW